jgi:hypothetical protein
MAVEICDVLNAKKRRSNLKGLKTSDHSMIE